MLRKQREEPLEEVPDAPDDAPVPDDAVVSTDNIQHLTELIGQIQIAATIYTQACPRTSLFCFLLYQLSLWWVKYRAQPEAIST